jgi:hypothetical protein
MVLHPGPVLSFDLDKRASTKAIMVALPLVLVEYTFALNGNKLAIGSMEPTQILLMPV